MKKPIIINPAWKPHATEIIKKVKAYKGETSFFLTMLVSGERNECLRQAIMLELTGEALPKSKCGISHIYIALSKGD